MLQNISYVCIGRGLRKCCSIEAVSDDQCTNTEQFYHGVRLDDVEELSDNGQEFVGKHAEFIEDKGATAKKGQADDDDDPDRDVDPDTVLNHQKFDEVSSSLSSPS